ncbi:MAG: phage minor head protein [Desulfobacteraceae bacterium]|nr:phage minor head protein [Desulfobacteraceae bacterium]
MNKVDLAYAFGLKPEKAIDYFKSKGYAFSWDWEEVWQEAHTKAFTVAKVLRMDILQDIRDGVQQALDNGITFQEFRKTLEPTLRAKGWWGKQEHVDESTGEITDVQLGSPYRLRTIFDQNLQTAYNVGRYRSQMEMADVRPFWEYVAVMDARTRPSHAALNGRVFRADDPFWDSFYPPNGWRCRCRVRSLDGGDLKDGGLKLESSAGKITSREELVSKKTGEMQPVAVFTALDPISGKRVSTAPDVGWSYNPGAVEWKPDMSKYSPEIKALF